jgi:hypothetical protein
MDADQPTLAGVLAPWGSAGDGCRHREGIRAEHARSDRPVQLVDQPSGKERRVEARPALEEERADPPRGEALQHPRGLGSRGGSGEQLGPGAECGPGRVGTQHQDSRLIGVAEPAPIRRDATASPDHHGGRLRGPARGGPALSQVGAQVRVEVVGAERAGAASHRVIGGAIELEQPAVGPTGESLGLARELRATIDAGDHVVAHEWAAREGRGERESSQGLVEVEVGGGIGPESVDAEAGHRCDGTRPSVSRRCAPGARCRASRRGRRCRAARRGSRA